MEKHSWRLEWSDELSVGIPEVDREHQAFIGLINELNQAIADRMALAIIRQRMQAILDDAVQHFDHEEALLRQWRYPDADGHAEKHRSLVRELQGIMARFDDRTLEYDWIAAGLQLKDALVEHLLSEDMKYRDFYRSRKP